MSGRLGSSLVVADGEGYWYRRCIRTRLRLTFVGIGIVVAEVGTALPTGGVGITRRDPHSKGNRDGGGD